MHKDPRPQQDHRSIFSSASVRFADIARQCGFRVVPYRDPALPLFSKMSESNQAAAVEYLERHLAIFDQLQNETGGTYVLKDSPRLIWRALGSLGFTPPSDIFDKMRDGDVVEVYSSSFYQLFRNLNLFGIVSVSLEELCSCPTTELVTYPEATAVRLVEVAEGIRLREINQAIDPGIPPYSWREKVGDFHRGETTVKWMAPIRRGDGEYVVLVISSMRNL